jgi:excisionase family DNA binding protein
MHTSPPESPSIPERRLTPVEVAQMARCSASFVRKEIRAGRLVAYRLGDKLLRIKQGDAETWLTRSQATGSEGSPEHPENSPEGNGAPSGGQSGPPQIRPWRRS